MHAHAHMHLCTHVSVESHEPAPGLASIRSSGYYGSQTTPISLQSWVPRSLSRMLVLYHPNNTWVGSFASFFMKNKTQKLFCLDLCGISCLWTLKIENATRVLDGPGPLYPQAPETRLWTATLSLGVRHELRGLKGLRKRATYFQDKPSFSKGPLDHAPSPQRILCVLSGKAGF